MSSRLLITLVAALGIGAMSDVAAAQCRPPAGSHEARLLAFYEAPIAFSMPGAPPRLSAGAVRIGAEAVPVPSPDPSLQHPEYCYANTTNNTKLAPLFGRPRMTVGLWGGLSIEGSVLPSITVAEAKASIASIALAEARALPLTNGRAMAILRVDGTTGRVRGAITCPRSSLQTTDVNVPCYGTEPSRDTFSPNSIGLEAALGVRAGERIALYAGGGGRSLQPRFRAGFTDALGNVDHTGVGVNLVRGVAFGGASLRLGSAVTLSTQLYDVPADVTTLRFGVEWRTRGN